MGWRSVEEGAEDWERTEVADSAEVGGIVLDEEVEDCVAVGAGECEEVHIAKVDAGEGE